MNKALGYIGVAVTSILLTMLLMSKCDRATTVTQVVTTIDTLYQERIVETIDTQYIIKWKIKTLVEERVVQIHDTIFLQDNSSLYTYDEYYEDSTYQVSGNIRYEGSILGHNQMFSQLKDKVTIVEKETIVYKDRTITKETDITRQPRFLIGAYTTLNIQNGLDFNQVGGNITFVDNKFRQYSIGKSVIGEDWYAQFQYPLFYSKKK